MVKIYTRKGDTGQTGLLTGDASIRTRRASAALHLARAVCRRAERRVMAVAQSCHFDANATAYLHRLPDLLFVMARWVDHEAGGVDRIMKKGV